MTTEVDEPTDELDIPLDELKAEEDEAPKRKRRSPFARIADAVNAGTGFRLTAKRKAAVRAQIGTLVGITNVMVTLSRFRDDALNEAEATLLTDALTAEAMNSERAMKWLLAASGLSPHVLLIQACVTIAIPRLQRRGILPNAQQDVPNAPTEQPVEETNGEAAPYSPFSSVPMETRPAFISVG
jgi:hypothetical protein